MNKKIIGSFILVLMVVLSTALVVNATLENIQASEYLSSYSAYVYPEGNGNISIWFDVQGIGIMDEIGALSIRLQRYSNGSWTTVKTYSHTNYTNMLGFNKRFHVSHVDYSGISGYVYRADVTIWAGKNGSGDSRRILTSAIIA